jgi:predicted phosphodiesterase
LDKLEAVRLAKEIGIRPASAQLEIPYSTLHGWTEGLPQPEPEQTGNMVKVGVIGDTHDSPGQSKERFKWMARWCADRKFDYVVQIGDWLSLDSLSSHEKLGSAKFYQRGTFEHDMESFHESLEAFGKDLDIPRYVTLGNHEYRADRAENENPNLIGSLAKPIRKSFADYGWQTLPYGEFLFIEGCGYVHIPFNGMGREFRGENPENLIGMRSLHSLTFGHTHKSSCKTFPKIGRQNHIKISNTGSAMPYGHIEEYAWLSMTGWDWGVKEQILSDSRIISDKFVSMLELEEMYGG